MATVQSVLGAIIDRARESPNAPAAKDLDRDLTYSELLDDVALIAQGMLQRGIGEGDRVLILLPNSVDFVVVALACLWIGAVFVPMSVGDPDSRLSTIADDCQAALMVGLSTAQSEEYRFSTPFVDVASLRSAAGSEPAPVGDAARVAYTIYTSGTTGTPKGVRIGSVAFSSAVRATSRALELDRTTRALCVSPFHFDGSFGTLFPTLYVGGAVVIRLRESLLFPPVFFRAVKSEEITFTGFSPSYLRILLASPQMSQLADSTLEVVALGGEASSVGDIRALWAAAPRVSVFNRYGPTETTIAVTHVRLTADLTSDGRVPLGSPHPHVSFYLIDEKGEMVTGPRRVGELYIGGVQLMDEYWRAPVLTREALRTDVVPGETVYRTGDLVFRSESGEYYYVDRVDRVVKRSGIRISLVEIGEQLRGVPGVSSAVCATYDNEGELGIVAFVVTDSSESAFNLRREARLLLPDNMLPDRIERVGSLPLTASGKLDERQLLKSVRLRPVTVATPPS